MGHDAVPAPFDFPSSGPGVGRCPSYDDGVPGVVADAHRNQSIRYCGARARIFALVGSKFRVPCSPAPLLPSSMPAMMPCLPARGPGLHFVLFWRECHQPDEGPGHAARRSRLVSGGCFYISISCGHLTTTTTGNGQLGPRAKQTTGWARGRSCSSAKTWLSPCCRPTLFGPAWRLG